MRRVVVFVEGQAEQIFVRELLLQRYCYDVCQVGIRCYKLLSDHFEPAEYDVGDENAVNFFQIINAGNDNKVLSAMLKRSQGMIKAGYQLVIGLRDMYSDFYCQQSPKVVSATLSQNIISSAESQLAESLFPNNLKIHYAIMEVEAWMLALLDKWKKKWNGGISDDEISKYFNNSVSIEDIYHPTDVIKNITASTGDKYDKHGSQVNSIVSNLCWEDYEELYDSHKCPSFNCFVDDLLTN